MLHSCRQAETLQDVVSQHPGLLLLFLLLILCRAAFHCRIIAHCFHGLLECLYETFGLAIRRWMIIDGAEMVCLTWLAFMKFWNTSLVNWRPLSLGRCSGSTNRANTSRNSSTVLSEEVDPVNSTSGHLLCASTMLRNICPTKGPA